MTIKMIKKGLITLTAVGALSLSVGQANEVQAQINTNVINEAWGMPTYVYGGGLSEKEVQETATLIGIDNLDNVESLEVTGEDLQSYLGMGAGNTSSMISSVLVQREGNNSGVEVIVETPENITEITEEQYSNAAITAGVEDATIMVASVRPVTGESALTGVYKAFDANGENLERERMAVAQQELETTNQISDGMDEQESLRLDQAIIEIKQELADLKESLGNLASREDIERIINDALANNGLKDVVSQEQVNQFIIVFQNYQETSAIDSQAVKSQLSSLANDVSDRVGEVWKEAEESGLIDQIINFFEKIWNAIVSVFN